MAADFEQAEVLANELYRQGLQVSHFLRLTLVDSLLTDLTILGHGAQPVFIDEFELRRPADRRQKGDIDGVFDSARSFSALEY